jgi:type II secretory pathway pseudopilin PulG
MASYPPVLRNDEGYALAALLVALGVMAVMLTAAVPAWSTMAKREKEAELVFRGEQYARAIGLYQRKMGPGTLPPSIDLLVDQKFLRKKYKDPITNDDFQLLSAGQTAAAPGQQVQQGRIGAARGQLAEAAGRLGGGGRLGQAGPLAGGISGVASKSTETSLRLYNNRNKYNEWTFVFVQAAQGPGRGRAGEGGARQGLPGPAGRGVGGRGPGASPFNPGRGPAPAPGAAGRGR